MNHISEEILKAIDLIVDKRIQNLKFDRTISGKIIEKTTAGYLVAAEGSKINVSVVGDGTYKENDTVQVHIPQNNLNNAYIAVANRFP